MPKIDKIDIIIRDVDRETWKLFRRLCLDRNKSANEMVKILITKAVSNYAAMEAAPQLLRACEAAISSITAGSYPERHEMDETVHMEVYAFELLLEAIQMAKETE